MTNTTPGQTTRAGVSPGWTRMYAPAAVARDIGYVLPGFLISVVAFAILVPLAFLGIGTLVIWVGAVILPATLLLASAFAAFSRHRARWWGATLPDPGHPRRGPGAGGLVRVLGEGRRWLELTYETLIAFPLRTITFSVGISWLAAALGGTTWAVWARFLPANNSVFPGNMLTAVFGGAISHQAAYSRTAETLTYTVFGLVALALLPLVFRALALADITLTRAALSFTPGNDRPGEAATSGATGQATSLTQPGGGFSGTGWAWIGTGVAAIVTVAVSWPLNATIYGVHPALAMVLAAVQAAAVLCTVRRPAAAVTLAALAAVSVALLSAHGASAPWPWPVTLIITQAIIVAVIGIRTDWRWTLAAWFVPQLAVAVAAALSAPVTRGAVGNIAVSASVSLGLAALAVAGRVAFAHRSALRAERRHTAALDEQQRVMSERNLVARELHDVVAHSMSVVSVQANTAKYRIEGLSDAAEAEFDSIAESSRQALGEMRGLLATLRDREGGDAPLGPQPTLNDLPALISATRQSGAKIRCDESELTLAAGANRVPPAASLTAYRVVQESLSNAIRHAPGATIDVSVRAAHAELLISVTNSAAAAAGAPGSGLGLTGLRERVTALGGTFEAGETAAGFSVTAVLPLTQ